MKAFQIKILIFSILFLFIIGCKDDSNFVQPPEAISFSAINTSVEIDPTNPIYEITLQTASAFTADKVIPFTIVHDTLDELDNTAPSGYYTLATTEIKIPAGKMKGSTAIEFDMDSLGYIEKGLKFMLKDGDYITNITRDEFTLNVTKLCPYSKAILSISTDDYPEETSFILYSISESDEATAIQEGGPYAGAEYENTDISVTFCLDSGKYAVVVFDSWEDGITGGGFNVTLDGVELVSKSVAGSYAIGYFDIP